MVYALRVVGGFVVAFLSRGILITLSHAVYRRVIAGEAWPAGSIPPPAYVVWTICAALVAGVVAGALASVVVGRSYLRHAAIYGFLFMLMAFLASLSTLFHNPHPEEWPNVLMPLVALPLGARLVASWRPDPDARMCTR